MILALIILATLFVVGISCIIYAFFSAFNSFDKFFNSSVDDPISVNPIKRTSLALLIGWGFTVISVMGGFACLIFYLIQVFAPR
jgi:hypothetical protein